MHPAVGNQQFIAASLANLSQHLQDGSSDTLESLSHAIGSADPKAIEQVRSELAERFAQLHNQAANEPSHRDVHYVSRFDGVGIFQSVLSNVFNGIPNLQGYGDANPIWVTTLIEEGLYKIGNFFRGTFQDVHGGKQSLLSSIVMEWKKLPTGRAPYPVGTPKTAEIPDVTIVALLADWGGDNEAARNISNVVRKHRVQQAVHLGDIYYGGTKSECETFLKLWPFQQNIRHPEIGVRPGTSFALNGNHEMYTGGKAYFDVVLPAFNQPQPFFCLENSHWRLIGLDTAYKGGRLKPSSSDDPLSVQWSWLIDLLKNQPKKANILLTHHQPVSAHAQEFQDSRALYEDVSELLSMKGIGPDAIFGWFFGHEHRCALYRDTETPYNARLIGNGCIPHEVQQEKESDSGCTPVDYFNKGETSLGSNTAVSMFAELQFEGPQVVVQYTDEDNRCWGTEMWDATKGRLNGGKFYESDGVRQR